jgi:hypothetical protein
MGETAARILLQRIQGFKDYPRELAVRPELIIRETTAPARQITTALGVRSRGESSAPELLISSRV